MVVTVRRIKEVLGLPEVMMGFKRRDVVVDDDHEEGTFIKQNFFA